MFLLCCGTLSTLPNLTLMPRPGRSLFPNRNKHHTTRRHLRAFGCPVLTSGTDSFTNCQSTFGACKGKGKMWSSQDGICSACSLMPKEVIGHFTHPDAWSCFLSRCFWKTDIPGGTNMCPGSLVRSLHPFIRFLLGSCSECHPIVL